MGKFEAADGGTLLLDEISEMDVRLQAKLLRALQEREIDRLGGIGAGAGERAHPRHHQPRPAGARSQRGAFREDLYFRLNVVSLRIPPLRERPGDIAAAGRAFRPPLRRGERPAVPAAVARGACCRLTSHPWRGNVRELENTIHRAVLLADGRDDRHRGDRARRRRRRRARRCRPAGGIAALVGRRMDEVERDLILETLGHTLGNRTHAATILGISIRALRNKLRDYAAQGVAVPPPAAGVAA